MTCHYCNSPNLEKSVWRDDIVYRYHCKDCEKGTSVSVEETCPHCNQKFKFLYDPGWNEKIICFPCWKKKLTDYFDDPEIKQVLTEAMKRPVHQWMRDMLDREKEWRGGHIRVPIKL